MTRLESDRHATFDRVRSAFTCVILLLAAAFALGQQPSETTGSICGVVSDENGAPRVTVTAYNPDAHLDWRIPFKSGIPETSGVRGSLACQNGPD